MSGPVWRALLAGGLLLVGAAAAAQEAGDDTAAQTPADTSIDEAVTSDADSSAAAQAGANASNDADADAAAEAGSSEIPAAAPAPAGSATGDSDESQAPTDGAQSPVTPDAAVDAPATEAVAPSPDGADAAVREGPSTTDQAPPASPVEGTAGPEDETVEPAGETVEVPAARDAGMSPSAGTTPAASEDDPDLDAAEAVVDEFHRSMQEGFKDGVLRTMAPDAVVFETGYVETQRDEYAQGHLDSDLLFAASVKREIIHREARADHNLAYVITQSHSQGTFAGQPVNLINTETTVLRRDADGWKIVHLHWSGHELKIASQ